jgi:thiosulfate reductase cytochrome b subunit
MSEKREILNPLPVRIWHLVNGVGIVLLIITGIQLRGPETFPIFGPLKRAIVLHNFVAFIVVLDYFLWVLYYLVKRELKKQYVPTMEDVTEGVMKQASYYFFRMFLGDPPMFEPKPEAKFNALQKITYFGIMFLIMPLQIITGILLYDIETFAAVIGVVGGVRVVDTLHVLLGYLFTAFLIAHLYLATLGRTVFAHFKAIILGYEE